ncbi:MAG: hydroxyacylglutathione hydrolase [Chitinivibrionales bacterium]|nr:hydroxyacylglutathione hydrolase [Chitinivibrionales bacterium]
MATLDIQILPVLGDNYIYLLSHEGNAAVVDPSSADAVYREVKERNLRLAHILVTHHHGDHTAGVRALKKKTGCTVWGPDDNRVPGCDTALIDGESFEVLGVTWDAMHVPGHTSSHMAYYCADESLVFTGDTLFVGGCGRLLEGTAEQMWDSLQRLAMLPEDTRVYCGHEYAEENYRFACTVAPGEQVYAERLAEVRMQLGSGQPTVPSLIDQERTTNVFLRAGNAAGFAGLRRLKDSF